MDTNTFRSMFPVNRNVLLKIDEYHPDILSYAVKKALDNHEKGIQLLGDNLHGLLKELNTIFDNKDWTYVEHTREDLIAALIDIDGVYNKESMADELIKRGFIR